MVLHHLQSMDCLCLLMTEELKKLKQHLFNNSCQLLLYSYYIKQKLGKSYWETYGASTIVLYGLQGPIQTGSPHASKRILISSHFPTYAFQVRSSMFITPLPSKNIIYRNTFNKFNQVFFYFFILFCVWQIKHILDHIKYSTFLAF